MIPNQTLTMKHIEKWRWLAIFWLAFYHLHDRYNIHTKFDNNPSGSFGDYLSIKIDTDRQTNKHTADKQTETGYHCFP